MAARRGRGAATGVGGPTARRSRYDVVFYVPWTGPLIAPGADLPRGGAETQIHLLARGLARRGARVCIVAYQTAEPLPESWEGVGIVVRPPFRSGMAPSPLGQLWEVATTWRTVARIDGDVFVQRGTGVDTGLVALAVRAKRRRFVYSSANVIDFDYGRVDRRRTVRLFELGVRLAHAVVVQTDEQVALCRARFGREPVVIKSIAEPAAERAKVPEAFLWVGKLTAFKRPLAYLELARMVPDAEFWMVGVPSEKDSPALAQRVADTAAAIPNVTLLAPRPRGELVPLYEKAVAVVSTSEYEGMPNTFLEGWARGVPALALTHDPDGVIERERVGHFAQGSSERMAELAGALWRSRHDQREVAARCRDYVRREHSPDAVTARWSEVLAETATPERRGHATTAPEAA